MRFEIFDSIGGFMVPLALWQWEEMKICLEHQDRSPQINLLNAHDYE
jgi:hypothetical protein